MPTIENIKVRRTKKANADDGQSRMRLSRVRLWLVDCDDTLYETTSSGMLSAIHRRMERFIAEKLGVSIEEGARLQRLYWTMYGATYLGLQRHHGIAPEEFFDATHRFDLASYLPEHFSASLLRKSIEALAGRKILVTNGPLCYIEPLVGLLGLNGVFERVLGAEHLRVFGRRVCKPDAALFASIAAQAGVRPEHCALIEDAPRNLKCAKSLGMLTVWCAGYRARSPFISTAHPWADVAVSNLDELARLCARRKTH